MKNFLVIAVLLCTWTGLRAQDLSVSTNVMDYVNFGTLNIEASYGLARHWTLNAGAKYNPFSFDEGEDMKLNRQRSLSIGTRYWPWHIFSGWWLSGAMRYQEYSFGGMTSPQTSEGDRYGGTLSGGYTYMVNPHFNLDFGLGMWAGYDVYTTYACQRCGRELDSGGKYFILPADIMLALTFVF